MAVEKILQLLASLATLVGVAPAFPFLDRFVQTGIVGALIAGFISDRHNRRLLQPLPATLLLFLLFFFYLSQMSRSNIVEPLVNMLVLLLAVRLITEKSGRNLLQIFVLATFVLAASSLLSLSISYLVALALLVGLVTFGLLLTSFYSADPALCFNRKQWYRLLGTGALLPLGSLLLMFFFFVLLPRTEYPLWNFLNPESVPSAGFSEEVNPGSLANLGSSGQSAFRARMAAIDPQELYWRGLVLNQIKGRSWFRVKSPPPDRLVTTNSSPRTQVIFSEPRSDRYLPGLDLPLTLGDIDNKRFADGVFEARRVLDKRNRYTVNSVRHGSLKLKNPSDRTFYLYTPSDITPGVAAIAGEIAKKNNRRSKILATKEFFIRQQLSYAARNLQLSTTPVETFLFESKRGYCEYFASSFALLLRLSGVPTRLVGGYLGGRYNALGDYYLVDEDMAHVWVEVLDDDNRWLRIDPSRLAINAGDAVTGLARGPFSWAQATSDYLATAWSRLVITYDLQKQLGLVFSVGRNLRQVRLTLPNQLSWWLPGILLLIVILWRRKNYFRSCRRQRLLQRYLRQVRKSAGQHQLPVHLGLFELAELSHEPLCHKFAQIYGGTLYRDQALTSCQYKQLSLIIRQLSQHHIQISLNRITAEDDHHPRSTRAAGND